MLWKVPALDEATTLEAAAAVPAGHVERSRRAQQLRRGRRRVQRWRMRCRAGWPARRWSSPSCRATRIDVLVRLARIDGTRAAGARLPARPRSSSAPAPARSRWRGPTPCSASSTSCTGFDHLLFVLALVMLVSGTRRLHRHDHGLHRRAQPDAGAGDARLGARAAARRSRPRSRCPSSSWPARSCMRAQGRPGLDAALSVGRGLHLRPAARPGLCQRAGRGRPAAAVDSDGAAVLQCRRRDRAAAVHRRGARADGAGRWLRAPLARATRPSWLWRVPPYAIGGVASFWVLERVAAF